MKNKIILVLFILLCEMVGVAGSFFTMDAIPTWYAALNRPIFLPPDWVFGPVWTILYAMMGIVAFVIWKKGLEKKDVSFAFKIFFAQLVLNGIWTPVFFGLKNIFLAFLIIIALWVLIAYLIFLLRRISKFAMWMLVPYLLWVSFASVLNFSFLILN